MLTWKLEVTIEVSEDWVADGYVATPARIMRILQECDMAYATEAEYHVAVRGVTSPNPRTVAQLQGYTGAEYRSKKALRINSDADSWK